MTPSQLTCSPPHGLAPAARFVEPVPPVRTLHDVPPSPSPEAVPEAAAAPGPALEPTRPTWAAGRGPHGASARVAPTVSAGPRLFSPSADGDGMGVGEGRGLSGRWGDVAGATVGGRRLRRASLSTTAVLPTQQPPPHRRHHRHRSEPHPDSDKRGGGPGLDASAMAKQADCILQQQLREKEKIRIRQQQLHVESTCRVEVVQNKTSRSAPQRGTRHVAVTTCTPPTRPQRWSLGTLVPDDLPAPKATWEVVLGSPISLSPPPDGFASATPSSTPSLTVFATPTPATIPTVSLVTQHGHQRSGSNPERGARPGIRQELGGATDLSDLPNGRDSILDDHIVRFVYPERACSACPGCSHLGVDAGVQVSGPPPLQLHLLPPHGCGCRRGPRPAGGPCVWLVQAVFCLLGLAVVILALALIGAAAFHATEGPHEDLQVLQLNRQQNDLVIQLATDVLVMTQATPAPEASTWRSSIERAVERSVERHEQMVLRAAAAGYGEGGAGEGGARIWTFPGGLLFAVSLLTTLGFGAPVPRTSLGQLSAVLLAVLGIPLNVMLALQLGRLLCTRLSRLLPLLGPAGQPVKEPRARSPCWPRKICASHDCCRKSGEEASTGFRWAPLLLPIGSILVYYLLGMLLFGAVLALPVSEWLMFPLSLTAAGGVARVPGWVRIAYAAYLEGGVLLAATAVALLQAPATTATTDLCMRLGVLDLDEYYSA